MASEIKFILSNLSLPPRMQAFAGAEAHAEYAEAVGADGYEFTPTALGPFGSTTLTQELVARGRAIKQKQTQAREAGETNIPIEAPYSDLIQSVQASPRFGHERGSGRLGRALLSLYSESLGMLPHIQRTTGRKVDAILRPHAPHVEPPRALYGVFAQRLLRPRIEDWISMGMPPNASVNKIRESLGTNGLDGVAWDSLDAMTARNNKSFDSAILLCFQLSTAGLIPAQRLSLGFTHIARNPVLNRFVTNSKQAFIESPEAAAKTAEGEMMVEIAGNWETADDVVRTITLETSPRLGQSKEQTMAEHRAIIAHARDLVADAKARPGRR
jgi:hypothetical protein